MYISPEDARSDIVLATAGLVLGGQLVLVLSGLLARFGAGLVIAVLFPVLVLLVTAYPSRWLVRWRGQGLEGHGLPEQGRGSLGSGLLLAAPVLVGGYLLNLGSGTGPVTALAGELAPALAGSALGLGGGAAQVALPSTSVLTLALALLTVVAAGIGAVLLYGMVAERAKDAFRSQDMPLLEALRTYGMGAVGAAFVLGLLTTLQGARSFLGLLLDVLPLLVAVLLTDRLVVSNDRTTRAGVLGPAIVVAVVEVFGFGGGLFGNLLGSLYAAALGGGLAIVVAALVTTRRHAWAFVPLVAATAWSPTALGLPTLAG